MKKSDIHDIILAGGSTRIPKIESLIREFFDGKMPKITKNPEYVVTYGAGIQG
jgi:molecular chaperone DnaK (HSP70)